VSNFCIILFGRVHNFHIPGAERSRSRHQLSAIYFHRIHIRVKDITPLHSPLEWPWLVPRLQRCIRFDNYHQSSPHPDRYHQLLALPQTIVRLLFHSSSVRNTGLRATIRLIRRACRAILRLPSLLAIVFKKRNCLGHSIADPEISKNIYLKTSLINSPVSAFPHAANFFYLREHKTVSEL